MGSTDRFTGLSNQGATCYMNSLLQTLFMTPEFLSRLYQWRWDSSKHNSKKDCIPYQLQLMFAKLHLKKYNVVETTGLTTSFQWDMRESLQQHDVQEFCRVLFDAIEESIRGTEQEKMITELYEGLYVDYVKCLECGNESTREDKFLDLSLAVRNSQDWEYNDSLDKALENFFKPDMLSGDNRYSCSKCNQRTDARKGLKFSKLPYILALQLKRFDLDCTTMQRKKINDKVEFPSFLNMSRFMPSEAEGSLESEGSVPERNSSNASNSNNDEQNTDDDYKLLQISSESTPLELHDNASDLKAQVASGYLYELFSIMIHSGSALGGHYYAYIKCFDTNRWYNFNDSQVKEIEKSDIEKVYGGIVGTGAFGANAYLLMYRQISDKNIKKVEENEIPQYLLEEIMKDDEIKMREVREREDRLLTIEVKVFYRNIITPIKANKHISLQLFVRKCIKDLSILQDEEDIRLRIYHQEYDQYQECFTNKESMSLDQLSITSNSYLAIESKTADEEFLQYYPSYLNLKVCVWRDSSQTPTESFTTLTENPYRLQVPKTARLKDLLIFFSAYFHVALDSLRVWRKTPYLTKNELIEITEPKYLNVKVLLLKLYDGCLLLLENKNSKSHWKEVAERDSNMILIRFNNPKSQFDGYDQQLMIESTSSLTLVKLSISAVLGIEKNSFIITRGSRHGVQLVENNAQISQLLLSNNSVLHIELEIACGKEEVAILVYYATLATKSTDDYLWYNFYELFQIRADINFSLQELKDYIVNTNKSYFPSFSLDPQKIRLREKKDTRLLRVIDEKECLKYFSEHRYIEIAIEECEQTTAFEITCVFRKWCPSTWELSPPLQLNITRFSGLPELAYILGQFYDMPAHCIEVCRVVYLNNFIRGDLTSMDWVPMTSRYLLADKPFFVNKDGATFV